jgi:hypothetical protein
MSRLGAAATNPRHQTADGARGCASEYDAARRLRRAADQLQADLEAVGSASDDWYTGDPATDFGDEAIPEAACRLIARLSPHAVTHLIPVLRTEAERADQLGDLYLAAADLDLLRFADKISEGASS